jgi:molybdate transport system ATP-binding protein
MSDTNIHAQFRHVFAKGYEKGFCLDVDLVLPAEGITVIFGHSGSGKTTLLRCIAGLEQTQQGQLSINDTVWQADKVFLPAHKRPLGYVFQESSLFEHLNVKDNLNFGLKRVALPPTKEHFNKVLELLGIAPLLSRFPAKLSGGERQRVAIARALLVNPQLLLMDEPLASLDGARKQEILHYLQRLPEVFDIPIVYVSHSVDEVVRLADHLVVLDNGQVLRQGPLSELINDLNFPLSLGSDTGAVLQVKVVERDRQWHLLKAEFVGGCFYLPDTGETLGQSLRLHILARDVSLTLTEHTDTSILNRLAGTVEALEEDNDTAMTLVKLKVGQSSLLARLTHRSAQYLQLQPGSKVWAQIKSVATLSN